MNTARATAPPRWKPHRLGIVGLWDYAHQVLSFRDGRMVLRGANGSGKTKALEVAFPFLFDANLAAQRLDPFSGEGRTMKQNLLFRGDRDSSYGYVWMEFRRDALREDAGPGSDHGDEGDVRSCTIGAGMQAHRHRDSVTSWYFVTDRSPGDDFDVVDDERRPLTRKQLREVLGTDDVFDTARDYRRRVDAELLGLGPDRFDALVQLVLFLRQPHLARELDVAKVSRVLSEGLRPLDDDLLDEAAHSFEDLEAVQHELDDLDRAVDAVERFLAAQRGYARVVARSRIDTVLDAERRARDARRARDDLGARAAEAEAERAEAAEQAECVDAELADARHSHSALLTSRAYQGVEQLTALEGRVRDADGELEDLDQRVGRTTAEVDRLAADVEKRRAEVDAAGEAVRARERDVAASAEAAGIDWVPAGDGNDTADGGQREGPSGEAENATGTRVTALAAARDAEVLEVRRALDEHQRSLLVVDQAEQAADAAETRMAEDERERDAAASTVDRRRTELEGTVRSWLADHPIVGDAGAAAVDAVDEVHTGGELAAALSHALAPRRQDLAVARSQGARRVDELDHELDETRDRRDAIAAEHDDEPPVPATRTASRNRRLGAPLWRLVEFADHVPGDERALLEAALEASGLLDAWVLPGHDDPVPVEADTFLAASSTGHDDAPRPTLADVLVAEEAAPVDADRIRAVLGAIPLDGAGPLGGAGTAAVGQDGSWRVGPLVGAGVKDEPAYVGATARAERRRRRVAELDVEIDRLDAERTRQQDAIQAVDDETTALDTASDALPDTAPLVDGRASLADAEASLRAAANNHRDAVARGSDARRRAADTRAAFTETATTHHLPTDIDELDAVASAITRFRRDGDALLAALTRRHDLADLLEADEERRRQRAEELDGLTERRRLRQRDRDGFAAELATLQETIGADAERVLAQLIDVEAAIAKLETRLAEARDRHLEAEKQVAGLAAEIEAAGARVEETAEAAGAARARVEILRHRDLRAAVGVEVDHRAEVDALVEAFDQATDGMAATDERRKGAATALTNAFTRLQADLGSQYQPTLDQADDVFLVTVADQGGPRRVTEFADDLTERRDEQASLLSAQERQVFEDTLLATLGGQLHARTREAVAQVRDMNASLSERATSSGITVQLGWEVPGDADEQVREITRLLDRDPQLADTDTRARLRDQFADRIRAARAADPGAGYRTVLAQSLDYRQWRRFVPRITRGGETRTLTRAEFNKLSGGEKATALHLPLFAAAASHYSSADAGAPRLIALDEAFAGIDRGTTERLMALTVEFDLDLFLTGHDLWATFAGIPGVSIYELVHLADAHAVHAEHLWWDGHELHLEA